MGIIGRLNQYGSMLAGEFDENSMSENLINNSTSTSAWNVGTFSTETQFPIKGLHTVRITDLSADGDSPHLTAALITTPGFHTVSHFIDTVNSTCTSVNIFIFGSTINGNSYASANFNLSTKTFGAVSYSGTSWANGFTNVVDYGNGIYRISITAEVLLATTATRAYVTPGPANTSYLILAGSQYESGTVATDYTPTFGTAKTRSVASTTNINISSTSKFHSSGFEENTGFTNTLVANTFAPYDPVYDDFGGALFGPGQGRYMRNNSNKNVVVYNEIDEVTDFRDIVRNGLVLDLDAAQPLSYPGYGTTWKDLSGNGYGGSLVGATTYSTSPSKFDTNATLVTQQNELSTSSEITFSDASAYTFDFWIKMRSAAEATFHSLVGRGSTNPWLCIYLNDTVGNNWYLRYRDNTAFYNDGSIQTYNIQQNWINITVSVNSNRNVNIYYNGSFSQTLNPTTTLFYVSRIAGGYASGGNFYSLQGSMAATKLYNRELQAREITQNYNALKHRFGL